MNGSQLQAMLQELGLVAEVYRQATARILRQPLHWVTFDFLAAAIWKEALDEDSTPQAVVLSTIDDLDRADLEAVLDGSGPSNHFAMLAERSGVNLEKLRNRGAEESRIAPEKLSFKVLEATLWLKAAQDGIPFSDFVANEFAQAREDGDDIF